MKTSRPLSILTLALLFLCSVLTNISFAETRDTGWKNGREFYQFAKRTRGYVPIKIQCKDKPGAKSVGNRSILINVTYRRATPADAGLVTTVAWYKDVQKQQKKLTKKGFKRVSYSTYKRPNGLIVPCALWHKRP